MKLTQLIDAINMAQGSELADNLESTKSAVGIGNAIVAIMSAYSMGTLKGQANTVYDDMLMAESYARRDAHALRAELAIESAAPSIVDAYQDGSMSSLNTTVCGIIEDALKPHVAEFEGE